MFIWCYLQQLHRSTSSCKENKTLSFTRATANLAEHMQQTHKQKQNKYCKRKTLVWHINYDKPLPDHHFPEPLRRWWRCKSGLVSPLPSYYVAALISAAIVFPCVSRNRATNNFRQRPEHHRGLTNTNHTFKTYSTDRTHNNICIFGHLWWALDLDNNTPKTSSRSHIGQGIIKVSAQSRKTQGAPLK